MTGLRFGALKVVAATILLSGCAAAGPGLSSPTSSGALETSAPSQSDAGAAGLVRGGLTPGGTGWLIAPDGLRVSSDGGRTFDTVTPNGLDPKLIGSVDFKNWPVGYLTVRRGVSVAVLATSDRGKTWSEGSPLGTFPDGLAAGSIDFVDANDGFVSVILPSSTATSVGRLFATTDGGSRWTGLEVPAGGPIDFIDSTTGWLLGGPLHDQLFGTKDGGKTWSLAAIAVPDEAKEHRASPALPSTDRGRLATPVQFFVNGGGPLLFAAYESTDAGASWTRTSDIFKLADEGGQLATSVSGSNWVVSAPAAGGFLVSTDGGRTFTARAAPEGIGSDQFEDVSVSSDGTIWAVASDLGCRTFKNDCSVTRTLWASNDQGATWSAVTP